MMPTQEFNQPVANVAAGHIKIKKQYQSSTPTAMRLQERILFEQLYRIDCSDAAAIEIMKLQAVSFGPKELRLAWDTGCLRYSEREGLITITSWVKGIYGVFIVLLAVALLALSLIKFDLASAESRVDLLWIGGLILFFSWMIYAGTRQYLAPQIIALRIKRVLKKEAS